MMMQSSKKLPAGQRAVLMGRVESLKNWRSKANKALPFVTRILAD
jgi:hypothetical protein